MSSVFHAANAQRVTQPRGKGRKAKLWLAAYWAGWLKAKVEGRRAEPWTGSAECYGSVASLRRITSLYPPYNSSLVGGLRLKDRKAKSKRHSFLVRRPTRRSRGRGVILWPVSPSFVRPRPLARALGTSKKEQGRVRRTGSLGTLSHGCSVRFAYFRFFGSSVGEAVSPHRPNNHAISFAPPTMKVVQASGGLP